MSEQEQQDVNSGHNAHINAIIDKEPVYRPDDTADDTAKVHKVGRHHKRHEKRSSSEAIHDVPQAIDSATDGATSEEPGQDATDIPVEKSTDTEKSPSIAVTAKKIADTPLPSSIEKDIATESIADTPLPVSLVDDAAIESITDTSLPSSSEETKATSTDETNVSTPAVSTTKELVVPRTPSTESVAVVPATQKRSYTTYRIQLIYALLALLLISTVLLWQDLTATHLYVNTIDAKSGSIRAQQDLAGYRDAVLMTAPLAAHAGSPILLGVYANNAGGTQQLLTLTSTTSTLSLQHSNALANGAITYATNGNLLVESANGLQVMAQDGQIAWQIQGQQPTHGVHHFQPVSDAQTVYTVKSVTHAQVAAYDLTNGHIRWTQTLNDTLEYAPPFLLDGETLYVASDHNVFALNSSDGTVLWEKPYAARTLLLENEGQNHFLVALGSEGMQALQSSTGEVAWWFRGDPNVSTLPTQFYQGSIGSIQNTTGNTVYATGVVWQMPQVRESVWLYAIDAATGKIRWAQPVASGLVSVDAGRGLQPLLDVNNGLVVVQSAVSREERDVTAYDANTGTQRWNTHIENRNTSSPIVFQVSQSTFAIFATTTNSDTILWTPSLYRSCILLLLLASVISLLLLLLPKKEQQRTQSIAHFMSTQFISIRRWRYGYTLLVLALLLVCISISIFAYTRSELPSRQLLTTDAQGSVVITHTGENMHQLEAFNSNGTSQWKSFSSEGIFSLPNIRVQTGTLLVALHGHTAGRYLLAEDDPAYPRPLDTMLALYLLNRSTGHIVWQHIVSYPDEQQNTEVIGADATYIYIAGEHDVTASTQSSTQSRLRTTQLFAVNKVTGTVDWRIFGPTQSNTQQHVHSTLLLKDGQAFWHVANTILTIDTSVGQIIARKET